ncbi:hypothetical protein [Streptomyces sp. NPDC006739]|uniref:hypothetical protein n=1 Tax=Streptomyces sp. NPDC006739 TaxID=3364763 RepID=UPI0036A14946
MGICNFGRDGFLEDLSGRSRRDTVGWRSAGGWLLAPPAPAAFACFKHASWQTFPDRDFVRAAVPMGFLQMAQGDMEPAGREDCRLVTVGSLAAHSRPDHEVGAFVRDRERQPLRGHLRSLPAARPGRQRLFLWPSRSVAGRRFLLTGMGGMSQVAELDKGATHAPARRVRSPSVRGLYPQASALKIAYEVAAIGAAPRT